ncbi:MAG: hypothetical protein AAB428_01050, partial [Patescibacteria group bacterium]
MSFRRKGKGTGNLPRLSPRRRSVRAGHRLAILPTGKITLRRSISGQNPNCWLFYPHDSLRSLCG